MTDGRLDPFRRNGSLVRYFLDGELPASDEDILLGLHEHRFRSIERAAGEVTSVGWVSPGDPSGNEFLREEICLPSFLRFRMRIDRKRVPPVWMRIHMEAEIKARGGRRPGPKERREIRADIEEKLLPRVLPTVRLAEISVDRSKGRLLLFGTSISVRDECCALFHKTFGIRLREAGPSELAESFSLPRERLAVLADLRPCELHPWNSGSPAPSSPREAEA